MKLTDLVNDRTRQREQEGAREVAGGLPSIVQWTEPEQWLEIEVIECWQSRGGPLARGSVLDCSAGLFGTVGGRSVAIEPGHLVNLGLGDADLPEHEFTVGRRFHVGFVRWATARGSGRQYRRFKVLELDPPAADGRPAMRLPDLFSRGQNGAEERRPQTSRSLVPHLPALLSGKLPPGSDPDGRVAAQARAAGCECDDCRRGRAVPGQRGAVDPTGMGHRRTRRMQRREAIVPGGVEGGAS